MVGHMLPNYQARALRSPRSGIPSMFISSLLKKCKYEKKSRVGMHVTLGGQLQEKSILSICFYQKWTFRRAKWPMSFDTPVISRPLLTQIGKLQLELITTTELSFTHRCTDKQSHSKILTSLFPLIFLSKHISLFALGRP